MKKFRRIILLLLTVAAFCACQPTPGNQVVVNKASSSLSFMFNEVAPKM